MIVMTRNDIARSLSDKLIDTHMIRKYAELKDKVINLENQLKHMADQPNIYLSSGKLKILYHECFSDENLEYLPDLTSAVNSFNEKMQLLESENKYENIEFMKISKKIDFGNIDYTKLLHYFPDQSEYVVYDTDYDYGHTYGELWVIVGTEKLDTPVEQTDSYKETQYQLTIAEHELKEITDALANYLCYGTYYDPTTRGFKG